MKVKAFEIRDSGTFIPAMAILMESADESECYLLRRAGFASPGSILFCRMDANGGARQASYDPYGWGGARTMGVAHDYIEKHWGNLTSGEVIDVQNILGETPAPKQSERTESYQ